MARPAANYKIQEGNQSSYNLIAHDRHIPDSPLFGPDRSQQQRGYRSDASPRDIANGRGGRQDDSPRGDGYDRGDRSDRRDDEDRARQREREMEMLRKKIASDYRFGTDSYRGIANNHHVPDTPLYRPGQRYNAPAINQPKDEGQGQGQGYDTDRGQGYETYRGEDPRYGVEPDGQEKRGVDGGRETDRPRGPPTPPYNTTGMRIPIGDEDDDADKRNRGYYPETSEYTNRSSVFFTTPGKGKPQVNFTDRQYRGAPWAKKNYSDMMADPRFGGGSVPAMMGNAAGRSAGVLLFIRFPAGQGENVVVAAQAFHRSKMIDTGGKYLGMANKVYDFGYQAGPREAIGVFHFPSMEKATVFIQTDPILKQPDFPPPNGHSEMFMLSSAYMPDNLNMFNTFLISEVYLHEGINKREFFEEVQKPFENYLYKNGAMPFVVCSYGAHDRKSVRRHMYPNYAIITCHLFQGLEHLNYITNDETYSKFRCLHNQMAAEKCSVFSITKNIGL